MPDIPCPLCGAASSVEFHRDRNRDYRRCGRCRLVYVPASQHLSQDAEKAIYDLHRNQTDDPGYRCFLSRLAAPLQERLAPGASGLDFGCGPGPALAAMLSEAGHAVKLYDPIYAAHPALLLRQYDFIVCTEVVEHFRRPAEEFERIFGMLRPGGYLGLMTKLVIDAAAFARWHYKNDLTHIGFYSRDTLTWLANRYGCGIEFVAADAIILRRNPDRYSD
ncbi:class I SAM-dependent methyltransferase [Methylomonas sp. MED-D]|uniref:class I SAM-dependent methyltransferase n=1 Tax=unclassified Methylomonas TaxID=2608980 RepID=UPI0028A47033|nr:class I SAM-dependent methyltransferase [Methylomonas sp. MV1]MDT4331843.1 class I SAM-dependent methyltransferase [Methylomonas sp. MV1]